MAAQPALLAHHCTEAGLTEKAVEYWLAAGRQAWGRSASRGSGRAAPPWAGAGSRPARRRSAPGTRARSADRARSGAHREPGLGRAGVGEDVRPGAATRVDAEPAARAAVRPVGPVQLSWSPSRSEAGATACRGDARAGRGHRRRSHASDGLALPAGLRASSSGNLPQVGPTWRKGLALYDPADRPVLRGAAALRSWVQLRIYSCLLLALPRTSRSGIVPEGRGAGRGAPALPSPPHWLSRWRAPGAAGWFVRLEPASLLQYADELLALATEHGLGLIGRWLSPARLVSGGVGACGRGNCAAHRRLGCREELDALEAVS